MIKFIESEEILESVRFTFFDINKCGYYPWTGAIPTFGSTLDSLKELQKWSKDKDLSLTKLSNSKNEDDVVATYLFDIKEYAKFWIIACWNETPSSDNIVASIASNSKVGSPKIHDNTVVQGTIPGFPTYFLFFPDSNLLATVKISALPTGRMAMEKYITTFLETQSSYVLVKLGDDGNEEIIGYTNKSDDKPMKVHPKFKIAPVRKKGHEEFLRGRLGDIRKVVKTTHINTALFRDRKVLRSLARVLVGLNPTTVTQSERRIHLEVDYTPSIDEFNNIVAEEAQATGKRWDDVGFTLTGDSDIYWLGRSRASDIIELNLLRNEGVVDIDILSQQIDSKLAEILAIKDDN